VKARRSELPGHALAINELDLAAPLAANRVEVARAARHLILAKLFDGHTGMPSLRPLDGLSDLLSAPEFNHFPSPVLRLSALPTDEGIVTQLRKKVNEILMQLRNKAECDTVRL
jgi:hypothetical protein